MTTTETKPKSPEPPCILVVDDEPVILEVLQDLLEADGYQVMTAENGRRALELLEPNRVDLVITDLKMPGFDGIELMERISLLRPNVPTIIMTAYAKVETAISAMKKGAADYILKPFKIGEITWVIEKTLERQAIKRENVALKEALALYQVSEAMSRSLDLDEVLESITDLALMEVGADHIALSFRQNGGAGRYRLVTSTGAGVGADGIEASIDLQKIQGRFDRGIPVLLNRPDLGEVSSSGDGVDRIESFISVPLRARGEMMGILNVFSLTRGCRFTEGQRKALAIFASRAAYVVESAHLHHRIRMALDQSIQSFVVAIEKKDKYTRDHSKRVRSLTQMVVDRMDLDKASRERICQSAIIHDIGKIMLAPEYINKSGPLSDDEWLCVKHHPISGKEILEPIEFFEDILPIIYHHHERYDGTGYPDGIGGEEIPLGARILSVTDAYDAMTSKRAYRDELDPKHARRELENNAGSQFDPKIVEIFLGLLDEGGITRQLSS